MYSNAIFQKCAIFVYYLILCVLLGFISFCFVRSAMSPFGTIKSKKTAAIPLFMRVAAVSLFAKNWLAWPKRDQNPKICPHITKKTLFSVFWNWSLVFAWVLNSLDRRGLLFGSFFMSLKNSFSVSLCGVFIPSIKYPSITANSASLTISCMILILEMVD